MLKKESVLLKMAKVIVIVSSIIGIVTVWGMSYYMLMAEMNQSQIPNNQVVLTQSTCAKITENKLGQGDCYFKVAKARRNESICGKIEIAELKSLCFVELAEVKNDFSICENNEIVASLMAVCEDYFSTEEGSSDVVSDSSDTDDWKIYRSKEYGFEMKYPGDFSFLEPGFNIISDRDGALHSVVFIANQIQYGASAKKDWGDSGEKIYVEVKISNKSSQSNSVKTLTGEELQKMNIYKGLGETLKKGYANKEGTVYSNAADGFKETGTVDRGMLNYFVEFESAANDYKYHINFQLPFSTAIEESSISDDDITVTSNEKFIEEFAQMLLSFNFID